MDLNDALLRLYNYHPRIEMKKTKKLCYKLYHQLLKQKFSREISSLCFRAHQFGNHHKKVKYLKSDNTPLIKIVANKKNTQICTNFKTNYFLMLLLLYKKNICVIGWRPPKWLQGTIGRYKKFATEIGKSENKNKQTNKQIEMVNRYHKGKHGMNVNGISWVHVVWMFVRKTEPVINLIPIMNRLDQTGSKWFTCAFQDCQVPITTSILSCLKILIFFWIPQKKYYHYQI